MLFELKASEQFVQNIHPPKKYDGSCMENCGQELYQYKYNPLETENQLFCYSLFINFPKFSCKEEAEPESKPSKIPPEVKAGQNAGGVSEKKSSCKTGGKVV